MDKEKLEKDLKGFGLSQSTINHILNLSEKEMREYIINSSAYNLGIDPISFNQIKIYIKEKIPIDYEGDENELDRLKKEIKRFGVGEVVVQSIFERHKNTEGDYNIQEICTDILNSSSKDLGISPTSYYELKEYIIRYMKK